MTSEVTQADYDPEFVEAWIAQEDAGYRYSESNIAKVYMGWQMARATKHVEKPGRFSEYSTESLAAQCRMQARENLDPDYSNFMTAVAARLTAQSGEGRSGAGEDGWVTIAARDGIEAGYGLNDIFPGDPVKVKASSLISDVQLTMQHARTFIASREKMHPDGIALYDEQVAALAALNARQSGEGERNRTIEDIAAERQRQIETEGWTPEHDDVHADGGELSRAAACYAAHASAFQRVTVDLTAYRTADPARHDYGWPWSSSWWKPSTPRRDLVKAGALIVAEIERLDRAALRATDDAGGA